MPKQLSIWDIPVETLEKVLVCRKQIEAIKSDVETIMGGSSSAGKRRGRPPKATSVASPAVKTDGRKRKRSVAARAKMAAAQKARWAKKNGSSAVAVKSTVKGTKKKKRKMSPEGKARIVAALKARWAKKRGDAAPATPAKSAAKTPKKRKTMSPEARAKIAAAQKARWAAKKAA